MKQTHILPQIPQGITDSVVEKYLRDLQKVIRDKHEDDYMSSRKSGGVGADIIIKYEIEALITHWCLVDPTQLPAVYQICDGSVWKSGSYAETFWTPKGLTKIPNLCGYGLRAADRSSTQNDPNRDDRRQAVTGQVLTGGTTVSLPAFYCSVIKEARDKGRTVQIGINKTDIFGTLSPVGTVSSVDLINNTVTVGTALTVGATALIIKGDCIGSFQKDGVASHKHLMMSYASAGGDGWVWNFTENNFVAFQHSTGGWGAFVLGGTSVPPTGGATSSNLQSSSDTRIKNISYLPIMYVLLPSQALVNINGEIRNIDALIDKIGANSYVSQIVQNHVINPFSYAFTATRASAIEIVCLTTQITTVKKESKIAVDITLHAEANSNQAFILERGIDGVFTEIGSSSPGSSRNWGISAIPYDGNTVSTMSQVNINFIDTPMADIGTVISYRLKIYGQAGTLYINRTTTDSDTIEYERATSNVRLTEFAGTPNINFGDTDVASVTEAKAGVDNTKVITPYGLRQAFNAEGSAPVYACRAWVNFNGTLNNSDGTNIIRASGNVSSVTDDGTGLWTINFTTPMPDVNYAGHASSTKAQNNFFYTGVYPYSVSQVKIGSYGGSFTDASYVLVTIFR